MLLNQRIFNKVTSKKCTRDNHVLACNFAQYSPILNFLTDRLRYKSFLIWLLTTPPHLKYIASYSTL